MIGKRFGGGPTAGALCGSFQGQSFQGVEAQSFGRIPPRR